MPKPLDFRVYKGTFNWNVCERISTIGMCVNAFLQSEYV